MHSRKASFEAAQQLKAAYALFVIKRITRKERIIAIVTCSGCLDDCFLLGHTLRADALLHQLKEDPDYVSLVALEKGKPWIGLN